jgi:hypothetical protein
MLRGKIIAIAISSYIKKKNRVRRVGERGRGERAVGRNDSNNICTYE